MPPYGSLQPIQSPPVPFFTLTLDFVLALPLSVEGYNALMLVTCKFSKTSSYLLKEKKKIPGPAEDWASALGSRVVLYLFIAYPGIQKEQLQRIDPSQNGGLGDLRGWGHVINPSAT